MHYDRDLIGYGANPPKVKWPHKGGAKLAVQFVINYEEGGENCLLHGDAASEGFLSEITGAQAWPGQRHWNMESIYEYGARAGFWRLHRLFSKMKIPATVYGVATALARSPEQVAAMKAADWEIASHGLKWIDYKDFKKSDEKKHIAEAIKLHHGATGAPPKGWYTGRCSANTVDLIARHQDALVGGFAYCSDSYADDLPYWYDAHMKNAGDGKPLLIIPYTLDANDMRFSISAGYDHGEPFFQYLKDSFDALYEEGKNGAPKMMSIGLHCRLVGRPGRILALKRFMEYAKTKKKVWFARRIDIANYWHKHHPHQWQDRPSRMDQKEFVARFGGAFEHSPWIASGAFKNGIGPTNDSASGLHHALAMVFRMASEKKRLEVLKAHPDLAGKLAAAKRLTKESTAEQASAGLDHLTDAERAMFTDLNTRYVQKFGFPFIIAVKGLNKGQILKSFKTRIENSRAEEFETACQQVEKIALLRLKDMLP